MVTRKTCRDLLWVFKLFLIENDFWHWSQGKWFYLQYSRVLVWVFKLFLTVNNFWHWSQGKCFIFSRVEFFYESSNCFWLRMTFDIDHKENILLWIFEIAISWKLLWTLITLKRFLTSVGSFMNFKIAILWKWLWTFITWKRFLTSVGSDMNFNITISWKWLWTLITWKRFLTSVNFKIAILWKLLWTRDMLGD